ncbi:fluoride efflux transporter FluC [Microlunatus antarcticus]|uniref:Fluoride-specific ion channel FluC n=1 Tax=Microlunatus antarcticus TaxID=53388 RepID=A0A7W5JSA1_9ACTN|nr:CrcB protein [Microlunatus antarcticus]
MTVLLLALAGGLGAVARFVLDGAVSSARPWRYPVATTLINLTGSFLLGLLAGLAATALLPGSALLVLGTGFLGGYTTFSTAAYEAVRLAEQRRWGAALLHGVGQVVAATALAALGYLLGSAR